MLLIAILEPSVPVRVVSRRLLMVKCLELIRRRRRQDMTRYEATHDQ